MNNEQLASGYENPVKLPPIHRMVTDVMSASQALENLRDSPPSAAKPAQKHFDQFTTDGSQPSNGTHGSPYTGTLTQGRRRSLLLDRKEKSERHDTSSEPGSGGGLTNGVNGDTNMGSTSSASMITAGSGSSGRRAKKMAKGRVYAREESSPETSESTGDNSTPSESTGATSISSRKDTPGNDEGSSPSEDFEMENSTETLQNGLADSHRTHGIPNGHQSPARNGNFVRDKPLRDRKDLPIPSYTSVEQATSYVDDQLVENELPHNVASANGTSTRGSANGSAKAADRRQLSPLEPASQTDMTGLEPAQSGPLNMAAYSVNTKLNSYLSRSPETPRFRGSEEPTDGVSPVVPKWGGSAFLFQESVPPLYTHSRSYSAPVDKELVQAQASQMQAQPVAWPVVVQPSIPVVGPMGQGGPVPATPIPGPSSGMLYQSNGMDIDSHGSQSNGDTTSSDPPAKRRTNLPREVTNILREWLSSHLDNPYPSEEDKQKLMDRTGLTLVQVSNWFINARRRVLPPNPRRAKNRGRA